MTQAKVTQPQADAYLQGWHARHLAEPSEPPMQDQDLRERFKKGYADCDQGKLDFDLVMGPDDFKPDVP
jgi:hypothetical protein